MKILKYFMKLLIFKIKWLKTSVLPPTWTAFSDYTGLDLLCSTVFHFSHFFFFIFLFRVVR